MSSSVERGVDLKARKSMRRTARCANRRLVNEGGREDRRRRNGAGWDRVVTPSRANATTNLIDALRREIRVENDADCFAASEALDGAGAGYNVAFAVILGSGAGTGIAVNGAVRHGTSMPPSERYTDPRRLKAHRSALRERIAAARLGGQRILRRRHGAGHHGDRVGHRHLLRIDDGQPPSEAMDVDAVGDLEHMRHVVGDEDDRQAALLHVENELEHPARLLDPERRRRLVHDDQPLGEGRRPRHGNALALAARKRLDRLVDILDRHQSEFVELLAGELRHPGAVGRPEPLTHDTGHARLSAEEHVVGDRQRRRQRQRLVDGLDARLARGDRRGEMDDLAAEADLAGVRDHRPADRLDERRLAGAVVADHGDDLAGIEIEVGMVERGDAPVALDELAAGEDGFDAHLATLRIHWSRATATMIRTPMANSCHSTSRPASETADRNTPTISAPISVPMTEPRPPKRLVPPITTAVMLLRFMFSPAVGLIAPTRPIIAQPAMAAMRPATT